MASQGDAETPRKGRSNEEIIHALHQVEGGEKIAEICCRLWASASRRSTGAFNAGGSVLQARLVQFSSQLSF